ncbi:MAG: hypothetical protein ACE5L7_10185 [Candidatus Aminicenantales bacterium]
MRKELFWDRDIEHLDPETEIERAINFGGFDYIAEVQKKYGMDKFIEVLMNNRNLSQRAVNYWCLVLGFDRKKTAVFRGKSRIWFPFK